MLETRTTAEGLLLTRQWIETDSGTDLIFWFAASGGPVRARVTNQESVCFIRAGDKDKVGRIISPFDGWRIGPTNLNNFNRENVSALYCRNQRLLYDLRDRLSRRGIDVLESDIKPTDRFLMERFITGAVTLSGGANPEDGFLEYINPKFSGSEYHAGLRALSVDIETDYRAEKLYSIALYSDRESLVFTVGDAGGGGSSETVPLEGGTKLELKRCGDARQLLSMFLEKIEELDPDVIIGWNIVNFDLRCLQNFADGAGIPLVLGRGRSEIVWRQSRDGAERFYAMVPGRAILDGIELMRTATYQFENFSLEYVARQLLGRGKLVDDVDQRGMEITKLFESDQPALARYNLEDCRLVWDIFMQERLLDFAMERSLLTGLELDRYGGSVAAFDFLYLPRLHRKGYVAPVVNEGTAGNISPGGYVMGSVPGIHHNVIVLDFKSLYPSIIRTFHVDPLAMVVGEKEEDAIEGFDGGRFSRTEYILPEVIQTLWRARDRAKAQQRRELSQAIKIIMNSFYGVLGTTGCRFFDSRLVSSITKRGHEIIIESRNFIESVGYRVIYGDTDSVFVLLGDAAPQSVAETGKDLAAQLNRWWRQRLCDSQQLESFLEIEFETHFHKFLMPTVRGSEAGSKKRYAGLIRGADGRYRLLFKGLETVRSDWSPLARSFQKQLYERIFLEQPFEKFIKDTIGGLRDESVETDLVLRKRLRRKLGDYVKNVPPHVQAARKAEAIRKERNLPGIYHSGGWVEYIMTTGGPEPRQYRRSPIDYDFYIEKQLMPIADSILVFKSTSMEEILNRQMGLF